MHSETVQLGILPQLVGFNLRRAYYIATQLFGGQFENITAIQFAVLELVSQNQLLSQKEIAQYIGTVPSVIVRPIRALEENGFVSRTRSAQDRRNYNIALTESGQQLMQKSRDQIRAVESELLADLSADERQTLTLLLHKIIDYAQSGA